MTELANDQLLRSHEGGLAAPYVQISEGEAISIARTHFGLSGKVVRFATEKDDTFRLDASNGKQYVLKIANPSETEQEIDFQVKLMGHIAQNAPELPIPRVIANRVGEHFPSIETHAGCQRYVRLMTYLPGAPLASTTSKPQERERIGALLAQLRHATADFSHPADNRILAWDVKHLPTLKHLLDSVTVNKHRDALEDALERFSTIESRLNNCRAQVLHNDFNTANIVVQHESPEFVTGIIDFGDAVRTAIAIDVSTALMNQFPKAPDSLSVDIFDQPRDLLRGYLRFADLTQDELEIIPHLAMGRLVTRALLTTWRAGLFPENSSYILRNTAGGWLHLDWFLSKSNEEIMEQLTR